MTDERATVMRRYGFVTAWVRWQIVTFVDVPANAGELLEKDEPTTTSETAINVAVNRKRKRGDMRRPLRRQKEYFDFWSIACSHVNGH